MKICVLDVETTGLDTSKEDIIELGYVVRNHDDQTPLVMKSFFLRTMKELSAEVMRVTGIKPEWLVDYGRDPKDGLMEFIKDIEGCYYLVGHNINEFDLPIIKGNLHRNSLSFPVEYKTIDTKTDLPLKEIHTSQKLSHLAGEHGFLNPFAHRALFDACTCSKLLSYYSFHEVERIAQSPSHEYRAVVSFEDRSKASKRGFRWDGDRKLWVKRIKVCNFEAEKALCDFPIVHIGG